MGEGGGGGDLLMYCIFTTYFFKTTKYMYTLLVYAVI